MGPTGLNHKVVAPNTQLKYDNEILEKNLIFISEWQSVSEYDGSLNSWLRSSLYKGAFNRPNW